MFAVLRAFQDRLFYLFRYLDDAVNEAGGDYELNYGGNEEVGVGGSHVHRCRGVMDSPGGFIDISSRYLNYRRQERECTLDLERNKSFRFPEQLRNKDENVCGVEWNQSIIGRNY